jgi:pimeloyl-ACP methyl ester carboxylesterase
MPNDPMQSIPVDSGTLAFTTRGSGPALLVPWCNLPWPELPVVERLAERYQVVMASPRGYQSSSRLAPGEEYRAETSADEVLAVCDALGVGEFSVLGYSLSAVLAGRLACTSARVTRAALGGFPLLGSYARVLQSAERDAEQLTDDPGFDPRAALALYRDLAELPDGALVDDRHCPMHAFWGSNDTILRGFDVESDLVRALAARGVGASVVAGADHVTTLLDADAITSALAAPRP